MAGYANSRTKRATRLHVITRAAERYGVTLSLDDVRNLGVYIRMGNGIEFEREGRATSKVFVKTDCGIELPVVWSRQKQIIVTVLPPESAEVQRALAKRITTP
jgi:hypothetical protein